VKRLYRIYREEGLAVRRRKRNRVAAARAPQPAPTRLNERWAVDLMLFEQSIAHRVETRWATRHC